MLPKHIHWILGALILGAAAPQDAVEAQFYAYLDSPNIPLRS